MTGELPGLRLYQGERRKMGKEKARCSGKKIVIKKTLQPSEATGIRVNNNINRFFGKLTQRTWLIPKKNLPPKPPRA